MRTCALHCNEIGDTKVEVRYEDSKLEKLCTDEREMRKKRADIASRLRLRINALQIAQTVGELQTLDPIGYWHELGADRDGMWAGKLSGNFRLLIRPEGDAESWKAVTVTVIEIVDYH